LSAAVLLDPKIARVTLGAGNSLNVLGSLATSPAAVNFELLFQPISGVWRLAAISVYASAFPPNAGRGPIK